jgi:hypothetical protein
MVLTTGMLMLERCPWGAQDGERPDDQDQQRQYDEGVRAAKRELDNPHFVRLSQELENQHKEVCRSWLRSAAAWSALRCRIYEFSSACKSGLGDRRAVVAYLPNKKPQRRADLVRGSSYDIRG